MGELTVLAPPVIQALVDLGVEPQSMAGLLLSLRRRLVLPPDANAWEVAALVYGNLPAEHRSAAGRRRIQEWTAAGRVRPGKIGAAAAADAGAAAAPTPEALSRDLNALLAQARQVHADRGRMFRDAGDRVTGFLERIATGLDLEAELVNFVRRAARQARQDPVQGYLLDLAQDLVAQINRLGRTDLIPRDIGEVFGDIDLYAGR